MALTDFLRSLNAKCASWNLWIWPFPFCSETKWLNSLILKKSFIFSLFFFAVSQIISYLSLTSLWDKRMTVSVPTTEKKKKQTKKRLVVACLCASINLQFSSLSVQAHIICVVTNRRLGHSSNHLTLNINKSKSFVVGYTTNSGDVFKIIWT